RVCTTGQQNERSDLAVPDCHLNCLVDTAAAAGRTDAALVDAGLRTQECESGIDIAGPLLVDHLLLFLKIVLEPLALAFAEPAIVERQRMNAGGAGLRANGPP